MSRRESLLYACVILGDLSVFGEKLTEADAILVDVALRQKIKFESEHRYPMLDVRFFLHRLSCMFTGAEGMNFLPSAIHDMEERLSGND